MGAIKISDLRAGLKRELAKIEKQKQEYEIALAALSELPDTFTFTMEGNVPIPATGNKKHSEVKSKNTAAVRIRAALERIYGEFTSKQLLEEANHDGLGGNIKRGTFAPEFAKLVKEGKIIVGQSPRGNQGGIYINSNIRPSKSESTPSTKQPTLLK